MFLRRRTVNTTEWTDEDTLLALALEDYEAGFCPGGDHVLAETSKPEHADAYRPAGEDDQVVCHYCKAQALLAEVMAKKDDAAGVFIPLVLDADVVARNKLPVPEPPTAEQLRIRAEEDAARQAVSI